MRLTCFSTSGAPPNLVPAKLERQWMDETNGHAYRCLPLNIANAHGWMVLNAAPFIAQWDGGKLLSSVTIRPLTDETPMLGASHFGAGVLTLSVHGLFRTEPGYDLMVTGPLNMPKDAIQPLTGIVETDWSPFSFTMNWKFTRAHTPVRFERDEPFCMIFPVKRGLIESVEPDFRTFESDVELHEAYTAWTKSRTDFIRDLAVPNSEARAREWQKDYFRGESSMVAAPRDHRTKLRPRPFAPALRWAAGTLMDQLNHEPAAENAAGRGLMIDGVLTPHPATLRLTPADAIDPETLDFIYDPKFLTQGECALLAAAARALAPADPDADQVALLRDILAKWPEAGALMRDIQRRVTGRLGVFLDLTVPLYTDSALLVRMSEGTWVDPHAIRAPPDASDQITALRDFASIVYLNDDFDGGEVFFPRLNLVVKPCAGMLLAFTGGWHHEHGVTEVVKGEQLTMPAFHTFHRSRRDLDLDPLQETP